MNNKIENKIKNFIARQSVIFTSKMIELKNEQIKINNATYDTMHNNPTIKVNQKLKEELDPMIRKYLDIIINYNQPKNNQLLYKNAETVVNKKPNKLQKLTRKYSRVKAMYDTKNNTIILKNGLQEREITHELMHMCSTITTPDVTFTGFAQLCEKDYTKNIGLGLTEGYTTMITNKIFKQLPDYNNYAIEKDIAKRIENLVGKTKMEEYYFNANLKGLIKEASRYIETSEFIEIIQDIDYIFEHKILYGDQVPAQVKENLKAKIKKVYTAIYQMHLYKKDTLQEEVEEYSNNYPAVVYMILADYNVINEENIKERRK